MAIVKGERRGRPGRWIVDVRDAAGIRRIITCRTREEAQRIEAAKRRESRQHIVSAVDANITLDDYVPRWLAQVKVTAKPRTGEMYRTIYQQHIQPTFGSRKVRTIQKEPIKSLLVTKLGTLKRSYVRLILAVFNGCLNTAVDDGVILANPCAGLRRVLKLSSKPGETEEVLAFDREQQSAFLAGVHGHRRLYHPYFVTLAKTGMRPGEGVGLQWPDIDFTGRTARIERTISRGRQGSPKGNRARTIDLSRQTCEMLRQLRAKRAAAALKAGKPLEPWVFTMPGGGPLRGAFEAMKDVLAEIGFSSHYSPKSLRHTWASIMLSEGESPVWVQQQLGHATLDLTVRVYGRWLRKRPVLGGVDRLDDGSKTVSADDESQSSYVDRMQKPTTLYSHRGTQR
jgi:integrase